MADDLSEVMARVLDQWKRGLRVSMPARIVSYDAATQTADVEPQIRRELRDVDDDRERVFEALPIIPSVPVCFPRFGSWFISFPIAAGDFVMLLIADQDLTRWRETGRVVDPYLPSSHHLSDAVALPGIFPASAALEDASATNLVIGQDGGVQVHLTGTEIRLGGALANDPVIRKSDLGAVVSHFNAHTHGGVTTGTGTSGPPSAPPMTAPSGSAVVKAD